MAEQTQVLGRGWPVNDVEQRVYTWAVESRAAYVPATKISHAIWSTRFIASAATTWRIGAWLSGSMMVNMVPCPGLRAHRQHLGVLWRREVM